MSVMEAWTEPGSGMRFGDTRPEKNTVHINTSLSNYDASVTLMHEALHLLESGQGVTDEAKHRAIVQAWRSDYQAAHGFVESMIGSSLPPILGNETDVRASVESSTAYMPAIRPLGHNVFEVRVASAKWPPSMIREEF